MAAVTVFSYQARRVAFGGRARALVGVCPTRFAEAVRAAFAFVRHASFVSRRERGFSGRRFMLPCDLIRGHCQAGSLTGAVHLSKNNAGVLRPAQRGQKPRVEQKGKSWLDPDVQYA